MADKKPSFLSGEAFRSKAFAFRIDEEQAFKKLRMFAVANPENYVLELVLCALASNATWVELDPGVWTITVRFDGEPFDQAGLETLYNHLMEQGEHGTSRLAHLAAGIIVMSHLEPRFLEFSSGEVRLTETFTEGAEEPARVIETIAPRAFTEITVGRQRRWMPLQWMGLRHTSEEEVLRDRAPYCRVPIRLGEQPIERPHPGFFVSEHIDAGPLRGHVGLNHDCHPETPLRFCYRGVVVSDSTMNGLGGWISSDEVKRNISLNELVEDAAYKRMMSALRRARRRLDLAWVVQSRVALIGSATSDDVLVRMATKYLPQRSLGQDNPARSVLEGLKLFETTDGERVNMATLIAELHAQNPAVNPWVKPRLVRCTRNLANKVRRRLTYDGLTVVVGDPKDKRLSRFFEAHFRDVTKELQRAEHERRFMLQPMEQPELHGHHTHRVAVHGTGIRGELGMVEGSSEPGRVRVLFRGRPIGRLDRGLIPGLAGVVQSTEIEPLANWTRARKNAAMEAVTKSVRAAHHTLLAQLADAAAEDLSGPPEQESITVTRLLWCFSDPSAPEALHQSLETIPLFRTLAGSRHISVADVRAILDGGEKPAWVAAELNRPSVRALVSTWYEPTHILVTTAAEIKALEKLVGPIARLDEDIRGAERLEETHRRSFDSVVARYLRPPLLRVESNGVICAVGRPQSKPGVVFRVRGVTVDHSPSAPRKWSPPHLSAVYESDALRTPLSRNRIDRGTESYQRARRTIQQAYLDWLVKHGSPLERLKHLAYHQTIEDDALVPAERFYVRGKSPSSVRLLEKRLLPPADWADERWFETIGHAKLTLNDILKARKEQREARIGCVAERPTQPVKLPNDRLVLVLSDDEREIFERLVLVEDVAAEVAIITTRTALLARSQAEEPVLPPNIEGPRRAFNTSVSVLGSVQGELAFGPPNRARLLLQSRHISAFEPDLDWDWAHVQAVINVAQLDVAGGQGLISDRALKALNRILDQQALLLLIQLLHDIPEDEVCHGRLRRLLNDETLAERLAASLGKKNRLLEPLTQAPIFRTLGNDRVSLATIFEQWGDGPIQYAPAGDQLWDVSEDVLLLDVDERSQLRKVFKDTPFKDISVQLERAASARRLLKACPPLDTSVPADALLATRIDTVHRGVPIRGVLWIPGPHPRDAVEAGRGRLHIGVGDRDVSQVPSASAHFRVEARLSAEGLELDGTKLVENPAWEALLDAELLHTNTLVVRLGRLCREHKLDAGRAQAARVVVLAHCGWRWLHNGHDAFEASPSLWDAPLWTRADGQGHVSLKTLLEDFEADGELGWLPSIVDDPEALGRDLAIVVTDLVEHQLFGKLLTAGWVDYRERLVRAPHAEALERLAHALDKAARCLPNDGWKLEVKGWKLDIERRGGTGKFFVAKNKTVLADTEHASWVRLQAAVMAKRDVATVLLAAMGQRILSDDLPRYTQLLEQLAQVR